MSDLNQCTFTGRLGRDPESRSLPNGGKVVNLNLAVSHRYKDRDGNKAERTTWVPVVIWNDKLGEIAEQYLSKGSRVAVTGEFQTRKWQDQSGADRYSTEIVLQRFGGTLVLLGGGDRDQSAAPRQETSGRSGRAELDDDIPFAPWIW